MKRKFTIKELIAAVKQIISEGQDEYEEAIKVASYLSEKTKLYFSVQESESIVYRNAYALVFRYCQYDSIEFIMNNLKDFGVSITGDVKDLKQRYHHGEKVGELNISKIPEFKKHTKKKYSILASYYNSHESGW